MPKFKGFKSWLMPKMVLNTLALLAFQHYLDALKWIVGWHTGSNFTPMILLGGHWPGYIELPFHPLEIKTDYLTAQNANSSKVKSRIHTPEMWLHFLLIRTFLLWFPGNGVCVWKFNTRTPVATSYLENVSVIFSAVAVTYSIKLYEITA